MTIILDIVHRLQFLRNKLFRQQDLIGPSGVRGSVSLSSRPTEVKTFPVAPDDGNRSIFKSTVFRRNSRWRTTSKIIVIVIFSLHFNNIFPFTLRCWKISFALNFQKKIIGAHLSPPSRDSVVGWTTDGRSSNPSSVKNFLFSTSSRPVLGSTRSPIQWIPGALSPGVKRPGREALTSN
jgi:hypothetical protein